MEWCLSHIKMWKKGNKFATPLELSTLVSYWVIETIFQKIYKKSENWDSYMDLFFFNDMYIVI